MAYDGEAALGLLRTGAIGMRKPARHKSPRETPIRSTALLVSMSRDAGSQGDIARLFDGYLQKPFSCEALMQVIEDARGSSDANTRQAAD